MTYKEAKLIDVDIIAEIHSRTFNNFFLTSLGMSFLKTYYKACIKSKEAISLCSLDENNNIVGFCFGALYSKGFNKRLILNNWSSFLIQSIRILFYKPKAVIRLLRNLKKEGNVKDNGDYAELYSIAVLTEKKGLGIGKGLLIEFEKYVKKELITNVSLTTDSKSNEAVLRFYKSMGYNVYYEFITYPNRIMFRLIKNLKE